MPGPNEVLDKGFRIATPIPWYYVVKQTDVEEVSVCDAAGEDWVGVAQEEVDALDVARGRVLRVRMMGITRAVAGAAVSMRDRVVVATDGRVVAVGAGADQSIVGIALTEATAAGDWIDLQLTPGVTTAA